MDTVANSYVEAAQDGTLDLLDGELYREDPYPTYRWLRDNDPVYWDAGNELWGITRYDDIVEIEKNPKGFISSSPEGGYRPKMPADPSMIGMDDSLHQVHRRLVARRFTPRAVLDWEDHIREVVAGLLDDAAEAGTADVVEDLGAPLPAQMIGLLLGYPHEMWPKLKEWSERTIVLGGGPAYHTENGVTAAMEFAESCAHLYEEKKADPADDIMSFWTQAEIDGEPFDAGGVVSDCLLLLDGGAETTRTVIARTLIGLVDHPDQWKKLRDGADLSTAVEEFIRYVTPIVNMCRMPVEDYELRGKTIKAGQQVVLMYASANRDEDHFDDPETLDVTRDPNHHISFGFGTHFCLGASLARLEIELFFEGMLERFDGWRIPPGGEPTYIANSFVAGVVGGTIELDPL